MKRSVAEHVSGTRKNIPLGNGSARIQRVIVLLTIQAMRINAMTMNLEIKEEPPLGIKPAFIAGEERIHGLIEAINRQLGYGNYENVKKYAKEIYLQADLIQQMEERED